MYPYFTFDSRWFITISQSTSQLFSAIVDWPILSTCLLGQNDTKNWPTCVWHRVLPSNFLICSRQSVLLNMLKPPGI
ncbi:unnamed protein product [Dicrocoelium dendriticum]|nr:unnamed protein product [Dicrocoelium dendriticum]